MFAFGNAELEVKDHRGWFVGHFMSKPPQQRDDIEIKWSHHSKGDGDPDFDAQKVSKSVSILIYGKIQYCLHDGDKKETIVVSKPGDYVMWGPGVSHSWLVLEDSISLTVRWPSLPNDVVKEDDHEESSVSSGCHGD